MADDKFTFGGKQTIELIRLMIRYDIPILLLGKSSIGKSFTIISLADLYRMQYAMLYIGSEKSEHIEGLPKLTGLKETTETLEYLRPYWFPNSSLITEYVKKGKGKYEEYISKFYDYADDQADYTFDFLNKMLVAFSAVEYLRDEIKKQVILEDKSNLKLGDSPKILNSKPFTLEREITDGKSTTYKKDDIRDICLYLCTLLGYGNFWLILDEIDKVEEFDIDKYAPLLHIVRERWLKNWNLREINDRKGIDISKDVKKSDYTEIKDIIETNLKHNQSLLDTRVIAIANKTSTIEEALFRRFVQIIIEEVLILKPVARELEVIKQCIEGSVKGDENKKNLVEGLRLTRLKEVNLQWTFNFFVKMLTRSDMEGNFIIRDYMTMLPKIKVDKLKDPTGYEAEKMELAKTTVLHKILRDNFEGEELIDQLFQCLAAQIDIRKEKEKPKSGIELVWSHVSEMIEDGYSEKEMKDEIIENLEVSYPTSVDQTGDKLLEVKNWVGLALDYIRGTMLDRQSNFSQMEVNKLLIPAVTHLIYKKITSDGDLNIDSVKASMEEVGEFWKTLQQKYNVDPLVLKGDADETQKAMYGATIKEMGALKDTGKIAASEDSIFGAREFIKTTNESLKSYEKSLSFKVVTRQNQYIARFIGQMAELGRANSIKDIPGLLPFVKEHYMGIIDAEIKRLKSSTDEKKKQGGEAMEKLFSE